MVEHGLWTQKMWEDTVIQTVSIVQQKLTDKVVLVLKIHPSSEKKEDYEKLLKKFKIKIPIFQTENLLDVINDADFIISYGDTWALWEVLLLNKPIIIVNLFNYPKDMMPFVKEGIAYEITEINQLINMITKIHSLKLDESKINLFIQKYLYKLDGKAGLRSAEAIMQLVENYNKLET
jgi:UDP-N-acetylglucosamine:LPS N-acetylglucosamine transferase